MTWMSPRGPMSSTPPPESVQDVYLREVKMVDGKHLNVEFDKFAKVKDPGK